MGSQRNQIRIDQTRGALDRLSAEVEEWLDLRRDRDERLQYNTQLDNLQTFFQQVIAALCLQLNGIELGAEHRDVYQACRTADRRLIWLREVWLYYAEKFDQRDDKGELGAAIKAADEVVWSCYAGFYENVPTAERPAPPLPYIEPMYTPSAIPRDQPNVLRQRFINAKFFREFLQELPIPVIGLPHSCVQEPWWLIYIGHEVGHHIQHDLLADYGLVGAFGACLAAAAKVGKSSDRRAARWNKWNQEVFADAFSVYAMGQWATWAMTELTLGNDKTMLTELDNYPAPAVRLELMAQLVNALGQDGQAALSGLDPAALVSGAPLEDDEGYDLRQEARAHLHLIPILVQAIEAYPFEGMGSFKQLSGWRPADLESIRDWTERLRERKPMSGRKRLDYPRLIASAGVAAWAEICELADAGQRAADGDKLVPRFLSAITESGPEDKRAAVKSVTTDRLIDIGTEFAKKFLETGVEELGL